MLFRAFKKYKELSWICLPLEFGKLANEHNDALELFAIAFCPICWPRNLLRVSLDHFLQVLKLELAFDVIIVKIKKILVGRLNSQSFSCSIIA